ncbi:hypothetical protein [Taibaiella koreensis]|uniref:hypothetical protein n=1 Tax=Taibaiella koreensis TaxID=1268548 RepID=UPI000E59F1EB|nr:hypothetical protein [Taibaiella koreensis]
MKKLILASIVILTGFASCYKDNAEDMYPSGGGSSSGGCDTTNVTFSGTIKPIIDARCATSGCHFDASVTGIDLFHYSGVAAVANSGKLVSAITHNGQASPMPKGMPKLDDCSIAKIVKWVNSGAPNN